MRSTASRELAPRAFTLVELLVVIGILTILLALLLPALNKAREHAKQVKCANNVRQITMSVLMYANEHKGKLPIPAVGSRGDYPPVPVLAGGDINHIYQAIAFLGSQDEGHIKYDWHSGTLWPYVDPSYGPRELLFTCPSDDNKYVSGWEAGLIVSFSSQGYDRNFSYTFNILMRGTDFHKDRAANWAYPDGMRLGQIVHSSHKILVVEPSYANGETSAIVSLGGPFANIPSCDSTLVSNRHFNRGNHGFADGHVESLFPEEMGFLNHIDLKSQAIISTMMDAMIDKENVRKRTYYGWLFADP